MYDSIFDTAMCLCKYILLHFSTHGLNWCDYDPKYPAVQIETAIRFHFFSVASMYKVFENYHENEYKLDSKI